MQAPTTGNQTTTTQKPRIRRIGEYRYVIESQSHPGIGRQVDTLRLRCSCPAGQFGRRCRHLIMALEVEHWRKRQQQPTTAAPATPGVPQQTGQPVALSSYFE